MCFFLAPALAAIGMSAATASAVSTGVAVAATVAGGAMAYQQSQQQADIQEAQAISQLRNSELAGRQANDAIERSNEEETRLRRQSGFLMGEQMARMAANGLDISSGSPLKALQDTKILEEEDAGRIRESGNREAEGFRIQESNFVDDAALSRFEAKRTRKSGALQFAKSLVSGASQFGGAFA